MKELEVKKATALENYKESKKNYIDNMNKGNWIAFCNAKKECMMLGVRI